MGVACDAGPCVSGVFDELVFAGGAVGGGGAVGAVGAAGEAFALAWDGGVALVVFVCGAGGALVCVENGEIGAVVAGCGVLAGETVVHAGCACATLTRHSSGEELLCFAWYTLLSFEFVPIFTTVAGFGSTGGVLSRRAGLTSIHA